jgi:hypothetical protein
MNTTHSELSSSLRSLDFSDNEAAVYLALVELTSVDEPQTTAGPLVQKTGFHRNVVYTALAKLEALKLINCKIIRGRTYFAVSDPGIFEELFVEKARKAKEVARSIKNRLPQSLREITIHQGNEEYLALLSATIKSLPEGSTKFVMGTGGHLFMQQTMQPIWQAYHDLVIKKKIRIRMIGYESQRSCLEDAIRGLKMYDIRYLSDDVENPAGMHIYPPIGVSFNIIYPDNQAPVTAIRMKNESLAKSYELLFKNLWKLAKQ